MRYELPRLDARQRELHRLALHAILTQRSLHETSNGLFRLTARLHGLRHEAFPPAAQELLAGVSDEIDLLRQELDQQYEQFRRRRSDRVSLLRILEDCEASFRYADASLETTVDVVAAHAVLKYPDARQILELLINNAIASIPENDRKEQTVRVGVEVKDAEVHISVSADGPGISPEKVGEIFELTPVNRYYFGDSYGMFMVRTLVEGLAGRIIVESELGRGSTFTVTLPHPSKAEHERSTVAG